jgi:hypothetical protein
LATFCHESRRPEGSGSRSDLGYHFRRMPHPQFTILLARQRSGTNALSSVLGTNPEIFCFDEVFRLDDLIRPDPLQIRGNYFTFLEEYAAGDVTRTFPDRHAQVFADYLAHLAALARTRLIVMDVKYNSTHHISGVWRPIAQPTLFDYIKSSRVAVLHLVRRNYLRGLLSHLKAWESKRYYIFDGAAPPDVRIPVPLPWALHEMERWRSEDDSVAAAFDDYPFYKRVEYSTLFPDPSGSIPAAALADLRAWFDVPDAFANRASLTKQSSLPLAETIENMDEVVSALRGTPFEHCLDDEPAYRGAAGNPG